MMTAKYSTYEMRVRAVQAVQTGQSITRVAEAYQVDRSTLHRWLGRYQHDGGESGLVRRPVRGRPCILGNISQQQLLDLVLQPASAFGYETDFWTCGRLRQVFKKRFGVTASHPTIWRFLRAADLTYKQPERRYFQASEVERQQWLAEELPRILQTVRDYRAVLYFEDEAQLSLTAVLAKTWGPQGARIPQPVTGQRGGISALSAISRRGELLFRLLPQRIASQEVIAFLQQILQHHPRRHVVVVMDQASPHTSQRTRTFIASQKRLQVFYLPKYSPDWNPDEPVWNHTKHQELKGHQARTTAELQRLAQQKLTRMAKNPQLIRGIFFRCCIAELMK